jgi:ADP-ribose pyrophosphatase YjhB (NUDIX family)
VVRLIGIYSTPHRVTSYADGHRWQTVSVTFLTARTGATLGLSDETTEVGFFSLEEIAQLEDVSQVLMCYSPRVSLQPTTLNMIE